MFERYTEKARRVIFFARYEALQYGSQVISPEHILLGLMREDKTLSARFFPFRNSLSVEAVRREVEERITFRERIPQSAELHLSNETKRILALAAEESRKLKNRHIGPEHLLLGILREEKSIAAEILFQYGLRLQDVRDEIARQTGFSDLYTVGREKTETPHLQECTRELTAEAAGGKLDPLIGRDPEIGRVIEILCRRTKNNPVLIGEAGVGKTAIIEGLAQRIANNDVPEILSGKRVVQLDLGAMIAGSRFRGEFEERLKAVVEEIQRAGGDIIMMIDELHAVVGAGAAQGAMDASNMLKPALARGELQCIGATTLDEYHKYI